MAALLLLLLLALVPATSAARPPVITITPGPPVPPSSPSLYIRNQPYDGTLISTGGLLHAELPRLAPLLNLRLARTGHAHCLNRRGSQPAPCPPPGLPVPEVPTLFVYGKAAPFPLLERGDLIYVPLQPLAQLLGAAYLPNPDTGIIDVAFRTLVEYDPNAPKPEKKKEEPPRKLTLLFVYQPNCPRCDTLARLLGELQKESEGRITVVPINVMTDKETDPYDRYLDALVGKKETLITPALILHDEAGKILKTQDGLALESRAALEKWLGRFFK